MGRNRSKSQRRGRLWQMPPASMLKFIGLSLTLAIAPQLLDAKTLSGKLTYDRVPDTVSNGLNYSSITQMPIRNAKVELVGTDGKKSRRRYRKTMEVTR